MGTQIYSQSNPNMSKERTLIWALARELNAINAKDGAEHHGVMQTWWDVLLDSARDHLGGDIKPWPDDEMKSYLAQMSRPHQEG